MNENMAPGRECYRLIKHWEKGPTEVNGVPWPRSADGGALKAYQCSAGKWTISFGVRWHPDGRPVVEGDTIPEDDVMPYLEAAMGRVASDVRRAFDIQLTQNQFDAITVWVYNLGIGRMKGDLKEFINQGRAADAAAEMCTYVYATTQASDGYPWKRAMRGLLIRRLTESCVWMGYDWEEACEPDGIALPTKRRFEPEWADPETGKKGRYYDDIQVGKTKLSDTLYKAQNYPLELVLNTPAPPPLTDGSKVVVGSVPVVPPVQTGTTSVPQVSPAPTVPPSPVEKQASVIPAPSAKPAPAPVPKLPTDVGSKPPVVIPPSVQVNSQSDMGPTTRTMWVSKRFWGGVLIIAGRLIIVADVSGHFSPAVKSFIGDGVLMDWMTGVIVTMVGEMVLDRGEKKATGPMDTPKRIALTTPAP